MTALDKAVTAQLRPGDRVLITQDPTKASMTAARHGDWLVARVKRGVIDARVTALEAISVNGKRRYNVVTEVGTVVSVSGSQTFLKGANENSLT